MAAQVAFHVYQIFRQLTAQPGRCRTLFDGSAVMLVQSVQRDEDVGPGDQQGKHDQQVAEGDQLQEGARITFHARHPMSERRMKKVSGVDDSYRGRT